MVKIRQPFGWKMSQKKEFDGPRSNINQICKKKIVFTEEQLKDYDAVIVSHTSPSRVHTLDHPLHKEGLHKDCDLLWTDIEDRTSLFNPSLKAAKGYFKYHYDDNYYQTIYSLLRKEINNLLSGKAYLSMSHVEVAKYFIHEDNHLDFSDFWKANRGTENHYTEQGNRKLFNIIVDKIDNLC